MDKEYLKRMAVPVALAVVCIGLIIWAERKRDRRSQNVCDAADRLSAALNEPMTAVLKPLPPATGSQN